MFEFYCYEYRNVFIYFSEYIDSSKYCWEYANFLIYICEYLYVCTEGLNSQICIFIVVDKDMFVFICCEYIDVCICCCEYTATPI